MRPTPTDASAVATDVLLLAASAGDEEGSDVPSESAASAAASALSFSFIAATYSSTVALLFLFVWDSVASSSSGKAPPRVFNQDLSVERCQIGNCDQRLHLQGEFKMSFVSPS